MVQCDALKNDVMIFSMDGLMEESFMSLSHKFLIDKKPHSNDVKMIETPV